MFTLPCGFSSVFLGFSLQDLCLCAPFQESFTVQLDGPPNKVARSSGAIGAFVLVTHHASNNPYFATEPTRLNDKIAMMWWAGRLLIT